MGTDVGEPTERDMKKLSFRLEVYLSTNGNSFVTVYRKGLYNTTNDSDRVATLQHAISALQTQLITEQTQPTHHHDNTIR